MPTRFTIQLTASFRHDLERLPAAAQEKVLKALQRLEIEPFGPPPKIKKLKGKSIGRWRPEVWPYRIRYDIVRQEVILYRVRHRKEIYQDYEISSMKPTLSHPLPRRAALYARGSQSLLLEMVPGP